MGATKPISAAIFSAFLKCPTKAHLALIGESAPDDFFANIEARISSTYKAAAKQWPPIGAKRAEPVDFKELWRSFDHDAVTHHVDCETAVYDFAIPSRRPGGRQRQELPPSDTFVPILFLPWDKPGRLQLRTATTKASPHGMSARALTIRKVPRGSVAEVTFVR
jgi:hypothetical protein